MLKMKLSAPSVLLSLIGMTLALAGTGCGNAKEAHAPQLGGEDSNLSGVSYFPRQNIELNDVLMFMWKRNVTADEVATVLKHSKLLDKAKTQIAPMVRERNEFKELFAQVKYKVSDEQPEVPVDILAYSASLSDRETQQKKVEKEKAGLDAIQPDIAKKRAKLEELKKQEPQTEDTAKEIAQVTAELAKLTKQATGFEKRMAQYKSKVEAIEATIALPKAAIAKAGLEHQVTEWSEHETKLTEKRDLATSYMPPINASAWVFNSSPMRFSFEFQRDNHIKAKIHNWKVDLDNMHDPEIAETGVLTEFTSEPYDYDSRPELPVAFESIRRVAYEPMGGIFTFEVYTSKAVYWFKLARAKYDAQAPIPLGEGKSGNKLDGSKASGQKGSDVRITFKAEIVRCSVEGGYGWPVVEYVRDIVQCGVNTENAPVGEWNEVGHPVLRRGAGNFGDIDDLKT
jgi:hypothetical protein